MNDLSILKDVGLKEVSKKTHIEIKFLEHIVNLEYDKITESKVNSYIKILQREYSLDLSDWVKEYKEYRRQNNISDDSRTKVDPKFQSYTGVEQGYNRLSGGSLGWLLWLFIIAGFGVASYFFDAHKYIEQIPNIFDDKNRSVVYSDSSVVEEVKSSLNIVEENITLPIVGKSRDENLSIQVSLEPTKEIKIVANDTNSTQNTISAKPLEQNLSISEPKSEADLPQVDNKTIAIGTFVGKTEEKKIFIKPKSSVWIGIIDTKNKTKKSVTTNKEFELDMSGEKLVAFGNGNITININGESKNFDPGRAARFLIKNGEIRFLTYDEFLSLNGGKSW